MNLIKIITKIVEFSVSNYKIYYKKNDNTLNCYSLSNNISSELVNNVSAFFFFNDHLYYQIDNGTNIFILNENKFEGKYYLESNVKGTNKIFIRGKNIKNEKVIFEIKDTQIKETTINILPDIVLIDKYISLILNGIYLYDYTNQLLWQHSFSKLLEAEQGDDFIFQNGNIVVHDGKLYFSLFERNRHLNTVTVCIDIETGKIEKKYKGFAGNLTLFNNKIAIAGDKVVEILDLKTHSIYKKDYSNYLGSDKLSISWNSFKVSEDELFYFIASDHRQGSYIGIIDLKTDELIWLYALNPDKETYDIGALDFKLSDNRMYVHCSDNTLHIFEKE